MKTHSIKFETHAPGGTKKVPVLTQGIEVQWGVVLKCGLVVGLGSKEDSGYWEIPLMNGNLPQVVERLDGRVFVYDCHPVPHREKFGRFFLANPRHESDRVLLRVHTQAGDQNGSLGAVATRRGSVVRVGYGSCSNPKGVKSMDCLLDVSPGSVLIMTAGGTGPGLFQKYTVEYKEAGGEIKISPISEDRQPVPVSVPVQRPSLAAPAQQPVSPSRNGGVEKPKEVATAPSVSVPTPTVTTGNGQVTVSMVESVMPVVSAPVINRNKGIEVTDEEALELVTKATGANAVPHEGPCGDSDSRRHRRRHY